MSVHALDARGRKVFLHVAELAWGLGRSIEVWRSHGTGPWIVQAVDRYLDEVSVEHEDLEYALRELGRRLDA